MGAASQTTATLMRLAAALVEHEATTLDAISGRALGKGGFFDKLTHGADCRTATAERVLAWFDLNWPTDLPWPAGVGRPERGAALDGAYGALARRGAPELPAPDEAFLARLAHLPIWPSMRRPSWWDDMEVREFLTRQHRQMSTLKAAKIGARRFGDRCPKKSAIHEYWQRLDGLYAEGAIQRPAAKRRVA